MWKNKEAMRVQLPHKLAVFAVVLFSAISHAAIQVPTKSYSCSEEFNSCILNPRGAPGLSHGTCLMLCGNGNLWPYPSGYVSIDASYTALQKISIDSFFLDHKGNEELINLQTEMVEQFLQTLFSSRGSASGMASSSYASLAEITISIEDESVLFASLDNDESYALDVTVEQSTVTIALSAPTYFGIRHAVETLSQLIVWDHFADSYVISNAVHITDKPAFKYRGVLVDTSRHFMSVGKLKETIRAMSYNKMNVLHLHLSDTASFPAELQRQPNVTSYGAYSGSHVYSTGELNDLAQYANVRGVMVLPEIDAPAHMEAGWQWGPEADKGDFIVCGAPLGDSGTTWLTDSLEPPSGQLNLANEEVYTVLSDVYKDVVDIFGSSGYFHMGGDEVIVGSDESSAACYNSTKLGKPILDFLEQLGLSRQEESSFYFLWEEFTKRASKLIQEAYAEPTNDFTFKKLHIWGGGAEGDEVCYNLMSQPNLVSLLPPDQVTIQVWDTSNDSIAKSLIQKGYDVVLSNYDYVYLDCGNAGFTNPGGYWCQPYHEWYHLYDYITDMQSLWDLSSEEMKHVIGSEALLWAEMVDDTNLAQKLWPRSAALAEALWSHTSAPASSFSSFSSSSSGPWYAAEPRMSHWRNTMVQRGVPAEALQPLWCQQRADHVCTLDTGTTQ